MPEACPVIPWFLLDSGSSLSCGWNYVIIGRVNHIEFSKGLVIMIEVNTEEARRNLSSLLDRVERGEEIIITRRGKKVALLVSPERKNALPSLKDFRASISTTGKPLSETVIDMRQEESY
jgi:prevent-host-death family protein